METVVLDIPNNYRLKTFELQNTHYITFDDYIEMDVEGAYLEWEDGRVIGFMPNNLQHQLILNFLITVVGLFVKKFDLGEIVQAGYAMKLEPQLRGREADLVFVRKENSVRLLQKYLDGGSDIAVEIVSPESVDRDRKVKYAEYANAGIEEYWLIDPERREAEFYALGDDRCYHRIDIDDGIFRSNVLPAFFLRVEWLWAEDLPTLEALRELNLLG